MAGHDHWYMTAALESMKGSERSCLLQTLFHKKRFRQDPFEWVYEGLDPLNLVAVLQTSKGISLSLAVLYISIARQLGIPMSMMPVVERK